MLIDDTSGVVARAASPMRYKLSWTPALYVVANTSIIVDRMRSLAPANSVGADDHVHDASIDVAHIRSLVSTRVVYGSRAKLSHPDPVDFMNVKPAMPEEIDLVVRVAFRTTLGFPFASRTKLCGWDRPANDSLFHFVSAAES